MPSKSVVADLQTAVLLKTLMQQILRLSVIAEGDRYSSRMCFPLWPLKKLYQEWSTASCNMQ